VKSIIAAILGVVVAAGSVNVQARPMLPTLHVAR
jgi:hypothetical protein